ncbi:MAG: nucleotide exchange factor GrpE [Phycisphaerae bacterium]|nr:nucleotide exchange factor GrpE [Phycisphaerae bacterium]
MNSDPSEHPTPAGEAMPPDSAEIAAQSVSDDISNLQSKLEEANSRALRAMADFQNYQRRAFMNEQHARTEGAAKVVSGVVGVLDHFDLALGQDAAKASAEQIIAGVRVIREELLKVLNQHGVSLIRPEPGEEFTPGRHEAIMQQKAEGVAPGRIVAVFQPGYALACPGTQTGERVLRAAKVSVSP